MLPPAGAVLGGLLPEPEGLDLQQPGRLARRSTMPSASTATTSGAATRMASSMALFTVSAEDGQPSQLPSSRRCTTPRASTPTSVDAAGVRAEVGAHPVERGLDAGEHVVGVQVVQHEQVADQLVVGEPADQVVSPAVADDPRIRSSPSPWRLITQRSRSSTLLHHRRERARGRARRGGRRSAR